MTPADPEEVKRFLQGTPLLGGLDVHGLDRFIAMMTEERFAPRATAYAEGDPGRCMYLIRTGEVDILTAARSGRRVPIAHLGPGETFGDMTIMDIQARSATVVATTPVEAYGLTTRDLYALYREDLKSYVIVVQNICRQMCRRLRRADKRIADLVDAAGPSTS